MERTIRVTGKGKLKLTPDTIRLRIELSETGKEYEAVLRKSTEHSEQLKEAFIELGFDKGDLKTIHFEVSTEYEHYQDKRNNSWRRRFVGYRAEHVLKIEFFKDTDMLGEILNTVASMPSKPEFHIEYTVKDTEAAKNELLAAAVKDSRIKAQTLTDAAGVKLREIVAIDYSWGEVEFISRPIEKLMDVDAAPARRTAHDRDIVGLDIEPDDIDVQDTVTVIWSIE